MRCCCESIEDLITAVKHREEETVDKVKKERSLYTFEFRLKVLKGLKNGQLAACDVTDKYGIHKSFLTKWKKEEKRKKDEQVRNTVQCL